MSSRHPRDCATVLGESGNGCKFEIPETRQAEDNTWLHGGGKRLEVGMTCWWYCTNGIREL